MHCLTIFFAKLGFISGKENDFYPFVLQVIQNFQDDLEPQALWKVTIFI